MDIACSCMGVHLYWSEIEIFLHTAGGIAISHSSWILVRVLQKKITLQSVAAKLSVLCAMVVVVMTCAICWEIFEGHFLEGASFQVESPGTRKDIIVGTLAGLISSIYFVFKEEIYKARTSIKEAISTTSADNQISAARSRS